MKQIFQTKSKRTTITVELDEETGIALIVVDRDGRRIHNTPFGREPIPNDG